MSERGVIFISHARPADDEITRWLCGRLTARGYRVWADLEQLLGGERFRADIQNVIRNQTVKFITIMSRTSVIRTGVLDELAEAVDVSKTTETWNQYWNQWLGNVEPIGPIGRRGKEKL